MSETQTLELDGLQCLRLLSAFQALRMPSGFYGGATHDQARAIIQGLTGLWPIGEPAESTDLQGYLDWLCQEGCER